MLESVVGVGFGQGISTVFRAADLPSHPEVGEASIGVSFDFDQFDIDRAALFDWVMESARATLGSPDELDPGVRIGVPM